MALDGPLIVLDSDVRLISSRKSKLAKVAKNKTKISAHPSSVPSSLSSHTEQACCGTLVAQLCLTLSLNHTPSEVELPHDYPAIQIGINKKKVTSKWPIKHGWKHYGPFNIFPNVCQSSS